MSRGNINWFVVLLKSLMLVRHWIAVFKVKYTALQNIVRWFKPLASLPLLRMNVHSLDLLIRLSLHSIQKEMTHVVETQVGSNWNKAYFVANQWLDTMNYKTFILKKYSKRFLKIQPDHGVGLISQQLAVCVLRQHCFLLVPGKGSGVCLWSADLGCIVHGGQWFLSSIIDSTFLITVGSGLSSYRSVIPAFQSITNFSVVNYVWVEPVQL